jgi:F-type H+-transporting ATPase subunit epsilon
VKLTIGTPLARIVEVDGVVHVRAEDASGAFGIQPRHTDLLTALAVSVVSWRTGDGRHGHCAVRGGVLTVHGGQEVGIATREAVLGEDLETLAGDVLDQLRSKHELEAEARVEATQARVAAIRRILEYLRPSAGGGR